MKTLNEYLKRPATELEERIYKLGIDQGVLDLLETEDHIIPLSSAEEDYYRSL